MKSDVAIIGGSFGAIAATLALINKGYSVILTEEYPWIGGQVTSQGLCVLDDYNVGEKTGCSRRYSEFRDRVRKYYTSRYQLSEFGKIQTHMCPGNARCSHLAAEPIAAHVAIQEWLQPAITSGQLTILTEFIPVSANRNKSIIENFIVSQKEKPENKIQISANFFLDGTESGDTFPLLSIPYRIGSEAKSEFNEPHAKEKANPHAVQSFTFCILAEFVNGGNFVIEKPANYEYYRDKNKFYLSSAGATREEPAYFLKPKIKKNGVRIVPFWNYRSVVDMANFAPNQNLNNRAVINVGSNDYHEEVLLGNQNPDKVLKAGRELSASYLYWLQTEAPRDEGGFGYPEIRPLPESVGTNDGIAQAPYIREGRRLKSIYTVSECDISVDCQTGVRAKFFKDSVGLGGYAIDIHQCPGEGEAGTWQEARHYQIPLGSIICKDLSNFAVAGKSLGVTHVANGAYRLHPAEWATGEAGGSLAAFCLKNKIGHPDLAGMDLFNFQRSLIMDGVPIYWFDDLPNNAFGFEAAQVLAITGIWSGNADHLRFDPQNRLDTELASFKEVIRKIESTGFDLDEFKNPNLNSHGIRKYDLANSLMKWLDYKNWDWNNRF